MFETSRHARGATRTEVPTTIHMHRKQTNHALGYRRPLAPPFSLLSVYIGRYTSPLALVPAHTPALCPISTIN
jgi:hypothetical protein